jgi:hyaluronan synthase
MGLFGNKRKKTAAKQEIQEILLQEKPDRRLLHKAIDQEGIRSNRDRRRVLNADSKQGQTPHSSIEEMIDSERGGRRYLVKYDVLIKYSHAGGSNKAVVRSIDISTTGMLLELPRTLALELRQSKDIELEFTITPGSMPEGYEMKVAIRGQIIRLQQTSDGQVHCGVQFIETLAQYATKKKNWYMITAASIFLFVTVVCIMLLRVESILYFKFNKYLYLYSIIAATFLLTRYLLASLYKPVPIDPNFTPGVSIVIPCYNEQEVIQRTILSCINQDYPVDKLELIIVDDCSTDNSYEKIVEIAQELIIKEARYNTSQRISFIRQKKNAGKREAMAIGAQRAKHELLVFVDSDSFLDPYAIRNVVQPFKDADMAGVSGRTDVANTFTNSLTKMQAVRYYIAFRIMKAAESYSDAVTCLSGPLSCYRKEIVLENLDAWLNQKFLGERATFGDDRSMTNFILRHHRTSYQDTAICSTIVPSTHKIFLKQQMRWKRSWLRESLIAARFMWKKEPIMALSFYMGLIIPIAAPIVVLFNLIYIPIVHRVIPYTFIFGIFLMAFLMSMAQLFLRKSSTWSFGLFFVMYYELILLWQMPIAWLTFWKTTWGTRMTAADVAASMKKPNFKQAKA